MRGLKRTGGLAWSARLSIPRERREDVARAYGKPGKVEDVLRSLKTRDVKEAIRRRDKVLACLRNEVDARLVAIGLPPLHGDWSPDWMMTDEAIMADALNARHALATASDIPDQFETLEDGSHLGESPRDRVRAGVEDHVEHRAAQLTAQGRDGNAYHASFMRVADGSRTPFSLIIDRWRADRERYVSPSLLTLDKAALLHLAEYLASHHQDHEGGTKEDLIDLDM